MDLASQAWVFGSGIVAAVASTIAVLSNNRRKRDEQRSREKLATLQASKEIKLKQIDDTGRVRSGVFETYEMTIEQLPKLYATVNEQQREIAKLQRQQADEAIENAKKFAVQKSDIDRLTYAEQRCVADLAVANERIRVQNDVIDRQNVEIEKLRNELIGTTVQMPRAGSGSMATVERRTSSSQTIHAQRPAVEKEDENA